MKAFFALVLLSIQFVSLEGAVVSGYYENWSQYRPEVGGRPKFMPDLIDPNILTDLNFAFAVFGFVSKSIDPQNPHLTGDYTMQPFEWNDESVLYPDIEALKQKNSQLRTHIAVGGWSFNDPNDPNGMGQFTYKLFSEMVSEKSHRSEFIESAVAYCKKHGFNGIDIDWEYPGDLTRGGTEADFDNFVEFLKELDAACKAESPGLHVTYASPAIVPSGVPEKYHSDPALYYEWLAECAKHVDWFNVMCYDYHGAFDQPKLTGVNAPLKKDTEPSSTLYIVETVNNYLNHGVPADKIVLGMPTYGHSFGGVSELTPSNNGPGLPFTRAGAAGPGTGEPGLLAYFEIADMIANKELVFATDLATSTAYGYNENTEEWVSFDTPDTIELKVDVVKSNGLKGAMFWAIDNDEYWWDKYPNISAAYNLLN